MRSSLLLTAAFAAAAIASPVVDKRGEVVVTDNEVVYVTQVVTVTAGQEAAVTPAAASTRRRYRFGSRRKHSKSGYGSVPSSAAPAPSSSEAPAPAPTSYEEPAPAPTSYSEPAPEPTTEAPAPEPTTEAPAPAPTSYDEPAPAPTSSQAPAPTYGAPPAGATATTYKQAVVDHHNYHRANHSSPDLAWSDSLAATAQKIAETCVYAHSMDVDGGNYGQNIAAGVPKGKIATVISDLFYNGEVGAFSQQYGKASPDMSNFGEWGHMSQIVWASTTEVGCYTEDCSAKGLTNFNVANSKYYTVCNYKVAGNMGGAYAKNIGTCLNKPTIDGKYNVDEDAIAAS